MNLLALLRRKKIKLTKLVKKEIISNLIKSIDYRGDIVLLIDDLFLSHCIDFFKKVVEAK